MAKIKLVCEQCGGNVVFDNNNSIGTCEHCFAQFFIKEDKVVQNITQNITKHVYGYKGKDVEELLVDGYKLLDLGDQSKANQKFKAAIDIEPDCWGAWLGYASTGGDRNGYISVVPAYRKAYSVAGNEEHEADTYIDMTRYLPDSHLRSAFIRIFNVSQRAKRHNIFDLVSKVIGCDESEIASLAVDLCPDDWRAYFAMAKFRQIRVRWCEMEGNFITGKRLPAHAMEVLNVFMKAYRLAKEEGDVAKKTVLSYVETLTQDDSYKVFSKELNNRLRQEG